MKTEAEADTPLLDPKQWLIDVSVSGARENDCEMPSIAVDRAGGAVLGHVS